MACTFFLHFSLIFADKRIKTLPVFYAASLIMFSLFSFTPYYLKDFEKQYFGYVYVPGSWNISFILFYLAYGLLGLYLVFNVYRTGREYFKKKQARYFLGAITALIVLGTVFDQFFLMLKIPTLPLATHISAAALGLIGYAILRYQPITTVSKEQISEAAADALLDAMFLTDADQKVNFANQAACQLSGFRIDQILGKEIKEILVKGEDGVVRLKRKRGAAALIDLKIFEIGGEKGNIYLGRDLMAIERSKADTKRINAQLKILIGREEKVKKYLYQLSKVENMDELNKILKILELEDKEIRALLEPVRDVVLENIELFEETHKIRDSLVKKTNELKELIIFLNGRDEILEGAGRAV